MTFLAKQPCVQLLLFVCDLNFFLFIWVDMGIGFKRMLPSHEVIFVFVVSVLFSMHTHESIHVIDTCAYECLMFKLVEPPLP